MKFIIKAPRISRKLAQNSGLNARLKILNRLPDKRLVTVLDTKELPKTSMMLFPGWLIPIKAEVEPISHEQSQPILVKLPADSIVEKEFLFEQRALDHLADFDGVPDVIDSNRILVHQKSYRLGDVEWQSPYFAMPRIKGQILDKFGLSWNEKKVPARDAVGRLVSDILPQLALRLAGVHERGMVHRDVKPNNALYDGHKVTLLDFGRANMLDAEARSDVGAFGFYPPELGLEKQTQEDKRTDSFGLGMTAFVLLSGRDGLLIDNMVDIWKFTGLDFMWRSRETVFEDYHEILCSYSHLSPEQLVARSNMPPDLQDTELGRYLGKLFHPERAIRPSNMYEIARNLQRLGGQLLEHELSS